MIKKNKIAPSPNTGINYSKHVHEYYARVSMIYMYVHNMYHKIGNDNLKFYQN